METIQSHLKMLENLRFVLLCLQMLMLEPIYLPIFHFKFYTLELVTTMDKLKIYHCLVLSRFKNIAK